jgi:hypothetical protein
MKIGLVLIAINAIAVIALATRFDRPRRNPKRLTGRGGDFE